MRVTDVLLLSDDNVRVLSRVSIILDDMLAVHNLALLPAHRGGLHLAFPRYTDRNGTRQDAVHPLSAEARAYIERVVFDAYREKRDA